MSYPPPQDNGLFTSVVGIVGALAGIVIERFMRYSGKVVIISTDKVIRSMLDRSGNQVKTVNEADSVDIEFGFDIYNSSEVPKSLRNIKVKIQSAKNKKNHLTKGVSLRGSIVHGSRTTINLPPRELFHISGTILVIQNEFKVFQDKSITLVLQAEFADENLFKRHSKFVAKLGELEVS